MCNTFMHTWVKMLLFIMIYLTVYLVYLVHLPNKVSEIEYFYMYMPCGHLYLLLNKHLLLTCY